MTKDKICKFSSPDCNDYYAKGVCKFHYGRSRKGTNMLAPKRKLIAGAMCTHQECERPVHSGKYCHTHDMQIRAKGFTWDIGSTRTLSKSTDKSGRRLNKPECIESECAELARRHGRCGTHHQQKMQGIIPPDIGDLPCSILDCMGVSMKSKNVCHTHSSAAARYGVSWVELVEISNSTNGICECCGDEMSFRNKRLREPHIDHDHACCPSTPACGKCVRGVICSACNMSLGRIGDRISTLEGMISYLEKRWPIGCIQKL